MTDKTCKMTASASAENLDIPAALERVGGDADLLSEIAGLFLREYPELLAAMQSALARQEATELERAAHSLKGSIANFGAAAAVEAAFTLEKIARSGALEEAGAALAALEAQLALAHPALVHLSQNPRHQF